MPNLSSLFTKFLFRETLTTEEKTAIRGDIGVPAPPTTESVLALLEGAAVEVDYIETADREGLAIPVGAYGQKRGIPYFGNSPLSDQITQRLDFDAAISNFGGVAQMLSALIGGITVPESSAVDEKAYIVDVEVTMDCSAGGSVPTASDEIYLLLRLGTGVANLTEGAWIKITQNAIFERHRFRLFINLTESAGQLRPTLTAATKEVSRSAALDAVGDLTPFEATTIVNDSSLLTAAGEATSLQFYVVADHNALGFHIIAMTGSINVVSGQIENLSLA